METTSLAWLLLLIQARQLVGSTPPLPEDASGLLSWSQSVVPGVRELAGPLAVQELCKPTSGKVGHSTTSC